MNKDCSPDVWYRMSDASPQGTEQFWEDDVSVAVNAQPTDAGCSTHQPPPRTVGFADKTMKRRRRTKIISLSVSAVVLLAGVVFATLKIAGTFDKPAAEQIETGKASSGEILPDTGDSEEKYDNYRDYFENYYSLPSGVNIPHGENTGEVTVEISPITGKELTLQEIYEKVSPAVVGITCYYDGEKYSWGTGVVFRADGYVITNTHVLEGADAAMVIFADGRELEAVLLGSDDASDIAVLKVEGEDLPFADFGNSDQLKVGDEAIAIGNPLGEDYAGTMTNGIISAINRNITYNGHTMTLLQTNAALNEGNSGGPLINSRGQVIGITNMKIMSSYYTTVEGIGFAIPSTVVKEIADQLIAGGVVLGEPTIGIVAGSVSSQAMETYGLPAGVYVTEVNDGSDAKEKGLQEGDIILEVNDIPVTSVAEVNLIKEDLAVGDELKLKVYREGDTFEVTIELVDKSVIK